MRVIDFTGLQYNHYYYIYQKDTNKKYYGKFRILYDYDYFYIAVFSQTTIIPYINFPPIELHFLINNDENVDFYIPEMEELLFQQILRQKIHDENFVRSISNV
jgi:hypothetical protein